MFGLNTDMIRPQTLRAEKPTQPTRGETVACRYKIKIALTASHSFSVDPYFVVVVKLVFSIIIVLASFLLTRHEIESLGRRNLS